MQENSSNKIYALVDCNAFFCSCEILFRPDLVGQPVGVLSNNDGCFVSRTKELKRLGVKMGQPYFKVKDLCEKNGVTVFSSNFSLYTNMSDRVMETLSEFTPNLEVYSVDEAFLDLSGFENHNINDYVKKIKTVVEKNTGIPVSIGVGPTKTLAKVANNLAKKSEKSQGIINVLEPRLRDVALKRTKIEDVWGIGKASSAKMKSLGIHNAFDFKDFKNDKLIQKIFTKVGLQRKEELSGCPRFELETRPKKKKQIMCSRTFSQGVFDIESLREGVAHYVSTASEKLRKQDSVCSSVEVFTRTSPFKNVSQYYGFDQRVILSGTSDTRKIIKYAFQALNKLFKAGFEYKKAGVRLTKITDKNQTQMSLFETPDSGDSERLMRAIDFINRKEGPETIKVAACGLKDKAIKLNRNFRSPRYVSGWNQIKKVL